VPGRTGAGGRPLRVADDAEEDAVVLHERLHSPRARSRLGFVMVAVLLLFIASLLPFAVGSIVTDILLPAEDRLYQLTPSDTPEAATHSRLEVDLISLNEWEGTVTLRVNGHHACNPSCPWEDRLLFLSLPVSSMQSEALPPSVAVTLPPTAHELTQTFTLPISGDPVRYPFDTYRMRLGVIMQRVMPDGSVVPLSAAEARGHLFLSMRTEVLRTALAPPLPADPQAFGVSEGGYPYVIVEQIGLARPAYLRVMTILLVLLVAAAAAFAVFMRPLNEIIINAGALVLGVWGIRAILVGDAAGLTAVDLSLATVILFLLVAITVRSLRFLEEEGSLYITRRRTDPRSKTAGGVRKAATGGTVSAARHARARTNRIAPSAPSRPDQRIDAGPTSTDRRRARIEGADDAVRAQDAPRSRDR
jgi:hypothetical protein